MPTSSHLAVAIVVYQPDLTWLETTLTSLAKSLAVAGQSGVIAKVDVVLMDNEAGSATSPHQPMVIGAFADLPLVHTQVVAGHGNVGFGAANNLAFAAIDDCDYWLVLNPDVRMDGEAIRAGIAHLDANRECVIVTPCATDSAGAPQYLARRYPSFATLALRGFAPALIRRWFDGYLSKYEFRGAGDPAFDRDLHGAASASGCFMLMRGEDFRGVGGFDAKFFLYFEDNDLSVRLRARGEITRLAACKIIHGGGGAAKKGARHIGLFVKSGLRFFGKHGWQLW